MNNTLWCNKLLLLSWATLCTFQIACVAGGGSTLILAVPTHMDAQKGYYLRVGDTKYTYLHVINFFDFVDILGYF